MIDKDKKQYEGISASGDIIFMTKKEFNKGKQND